MKSLIGIAILSLSISFTYAQEASGTSGREDVFPLKPGTEELMGRPVERPLRGEMLLPLEWYGNPYHRSQLRSGFYISEGARFLVEEKRWILSAGMMSTSLAAQIPGLSENDIKWLHKLAAANGLSSEDRLIPASLVIAASRVKAEMEQTATEKINLNVSSLVDAFLAMNLPYPAQSLEHIKDADSIMGNQSLISADSEGDKKPLAESQVPEPALLKNLRSVK